MKSRKHWFCNKMFVTFAPERNADEYGVNTSSYSDSITVYFTPGSVSPPAFKLLRNGEPAICSLHAAHNDVTNDGPPGSTASKPVSPKRFVPWFDGAMPTSVSTFDAPPRNF